MHTNKWKQTTFKIHQHTHTQTHMPSEGTLSPLHKELLSLFVMQWQAADCDTGVYEEV